MKTNKLDYGIGCFFIFVVLLLLAAVVFEFMATCSNEHEVTGTVASTYIKTVDKEDHFFVIITTEEGETLVFENIDNWLYGKVNSADVYGQMRTGRKVTVTVVGYRVPLLNMFPNIVKVKE